MWLGSLVDVLALCVQGRASSQPWSAWTLPWPLLLASLNIRGQAGVLVGGSRAGFSQPKSVVGLTLPQVGPMPGHCPRAGFSGRFGVAWGLSCGGGRGARSRSAGGLVGSGEQSRRGRWQAWEELLPAAWLLGPTGCRPTLSPDCGSWEVVEVSGCSACLWHPGDQWLNISGRASR